MSKYAVCWTEIKTGRSGFTKDSKLSHEFTQWFDSQSAAETERKEFEVAYALLAQEKNTKPHLRFWVMEKKDGEHTTD